MLISLLLTLQNRYSLSSFFFHPTTLQIHSKFPKNPSNRPNKILSNYPSGISKPSTKSSSNLPLPQTLIEFKGGRQVNDMLISLLLLPSKTVTSFSTLQLFISLTVLVSNTDVMFSLSKSTFPISRSTLPGWVEEELESDFVENKRFGWRKGIEEEIRKILWGWKVSPT